jgi:hypothetical protein
MVGWRGALEERDSSLDVSLELWASVLSAFAIQRKYLTHHLTSQ